jgi:hypothetical protein
MMRSHVYGHDGHQKKSKPPSRMRALRTISSCVVALTIVFVTFPTSALASAPLGGAHQTVTTGTTLETLGTNVGSSPTNNPPSNEPPNPSVENCSGEQVNAAPDNSITCTADALATIDNARASEGVSPLSFDLASFEAMAPAEQLFVIANLERVDRGLQPIAYLTTQLDQYAQTGAQNSTDPGFPSTLTGGAKLKTGASNFAQGAANALIANDLWMYDDGPGGPNADCTSSNSSGCWGHRDGILLADPERGCFLVMGAATVAAGPGLGLSWTEEFIDACGRAPTDQVLTWTDAEKALAGAGQFEVSTQTLVDPTDFQSSYSDWLEVENGVGPFSWTVTSGTLPPGYALSNTGQLTGPVNGPAGPFNFTVTVTEGTSSPPQSPPPSPPPSASASISLSLVFPQPIIKPPVVKGSVPKAPSIRAFSTVQGTITISVTRTINNGGNAITAYQYSLNGGSWRKVSRRSNGTFIINHLVKGKTYRVRLRAINGVGTGTASHEASVKVK